MAPCLVSGHDRLKAQAQEVLEAARQRAQLKSNYDSLTAREELIQATKARLGFEPHEWQVDVTEALLHKLDVVLIAGTGCGKTAPFMMSLLQDTCKRILVISPLKALQDDQVRRFRKVGISAMAVNGDTWNRKFYQQLRDTQPQALFASPEMSLTHVEFRKYLADVGW
ncbi:hypothetical protein NP233_g8725 [Leucocoprinus birnbaumii]|uniref:Helicase ATP-binding domain-containing protein n=1 Tax=Leucocoprinus birnbaumii TaxID=56174 RepID=A0AAD5YRK4_9AGAR|nr:hypothetical protein NP233_g8725 [Leucocoprinus birnbaumii]